MGEAVPMPAPTAPTLGDEDDSEMLVYEWTSKAQGASSAGAVGNFVLLFESVEGIQAEVFEALLVGVQLGGTDVDPVDLRAALGELGCVVQAQAGPEWVMAGLAVGASQPDSSSVHPELEGSSALIEESVCWRVGQEDSCAAEPDASETVPGEGSEPSDDLLEMFHSGRALDLCTWREISRRA
jgi:hypothetical protein